MPSDFPVIASGEHLTIATMGIEKRLIQSIAIDETGGTYTDGTPLTWYNLRIHQQDGSFLEWADSERHLVYNTEKSINRLMARDYNHFQVDDTVQIGGHQFESRMLRCWQADLCHPDYPKLKIWLHEMPPKKYLMIDSLPYKTLKEQIVQMLLTIHQCSHKDAWNAVNCRH